MPRGDRTGPLGLGPMTGRAAGYCAGYTVPGYMNPYGGRGMGFRMGFRGGFGRGRGFGGFGYSEMPLAAPGAPVAPQQWPDPGLIDENAELNALRSQSQAIEETLTHIKKRIEELENRKPAEKEE